MRRRRARPGASLLMRSDAGAAIAVQSVGRADRVSSLGSGHVHAICRSWVGGLHSRRHDAVAVPREARAGRADRDAVRSVRPASHREGLYRARRADGGCEHCADAEAAQHARGERGSYIKRGETPAEWERKPAKNRQKDKDARWTKKHGRSFFGYKNHVNVDRTHKLI